MVHLQYHYLIALDARPFAPPLLHVNGYRLVFCTLDIGQTLVVSIGGLLVSGVREGGGETMDREWEETFGPELSGGRG